MGLRVQKTSMGIVKATDYLALVEIKMSHNHKSGNILQI